ncbi:restriction endonuclease subunit S [Gluconacetobacter entanii]|uniref:Restriction endonuclease subunit S n=1 Tax=Gluconacetobacter entanii TaxID=108528 RepID=A0A318PUT7_9PROT|nr:restriction endonuclease subunit S [Gluconacetobacter entanii]PYD61364.1 restriction endonuclease subunit S [Gluconacetobacter entanii]
MQQLLTGKKRLPGFTGEWKKVSLEKTGKIVSGGTPDTTVPAYWDGDVLWLTPTDVTSLREKYVDDTKRKITQAGIKDSATTLLPAGSLLVCTRATIGYMAIAKKPITTNQGFKNIVFNKLFLPEFVYYFLCTQKHEMQRLASGSTFAEISKKDFCKIHISAPPLPEQKAIAAVLTTADEEIASLESDLSRLRQEKKALMQQLLTGKRRVKVD